MQEIWIATMNVQQENYNVYFSEDRAEKAVSIMRERLEEMADHFDPHVIDRVAEGEAFGEEVCVEGKRQYDEVFL